MKLNSNQVMTGAAVGFALFALWFITKKDTTGNGTSSDGFAGFNLYLGPDAEMSGRIDRQLAITSGDFARADRAAYYGG